MSTNCIRPSKSSYVLLKFSPICVTTVPLSKYSIFVSRMITWYITINPLCSSSEGRSHDNVILRDVSTVTLTFGVSVGAVKSEEKQ